MIKKKDDVIYLDHNGTTPVDPEVVKAMMPYLGSEFGNPSSGYPLGKRAKAGVDQARQDVASLIGCEPQEVVFASGGSEANNMVLKGLIDFKRPEEFHIVTSSVEHPAILEPARFLRTLGVGITILPVDRFGLVDPDDVKKAILPETILISIMLANNETGTLEPIREISRIAKEHGILVHTDAAQAVGKMGVAVSDLGVDFLTIAGHKLYGPKGIGALYIRDGQNITPLIHGAAQENGLRAGTENVILASGLGAACGIAKRRLRDDQKHMRIVRNRLQDLLFDEIDGLVLNGHPERRLPNTLSISIPGIRGAEILEGLPSIMASTGAACHQNEIRLSYVLSAMGVLPEIGMGTLRLTLGRSNTTKQIEEAARQIIDRVKRIRNDK
jgi:cysteine desulfurase